MEFPLLHPDVVAPDLDYHREITKVRPLQEIIFKIKAKLRPDKNYLLKFINHKNF
ncbi:hypothetical protein JYQ62_10590 [Nostoc sp. UHCC 0702]|nr:hypothetical protein JYQ62_10590 [Nostoc sp. UHCC 0702]